MQQQRISVAPATATGGAGRTPPPPNLPLGTSGGGSLDRNLKSISNGDEGFNALVQAQKDSFAKEAAALPKNVTPLRTITSTLGGDIRQPQLAALVQNESRLAQNLATYEKTKPGGINDLLQ